MAFSKVALLCAVLGLVQLSSVAATRLLRGETASSQNSTGRSLQSYQPQFNTVSDWRGASATFFKGWDSCHCGFSPMNENCNANGQMGVAMSKSFFDAYGGHGDGDTWNGNGGPNFFGERGMCGRCIEVQCLGCHDNAAGHAGCNNGHNGCNAAGASVIVRVLDLLWEGDANRNTVKYHDNGLANWNDCTDFNYCPKGDGSDYAKRMDMYQPAFSSIADTVTGIIKVQWRFVSDWKCSG